MSSRSIAHTACTYTPSHIVLCKRFYGVPTYQVIIVSLCTVDVLSLAMAVVTMNHRHDGVTHYACVPAPRLSIEPIKYRQFAVW